MEFSEGSKSFEMCTDCSSEPASPAHILECLGLTKQDLADDPLPVLDYLRMYDVMWTWSSTADQRGHATTTDLRNLKDLPMWPRRKTVAEFRLVTGHDCLLENLYRIHVAPFCPL
ncbi:RNase H domain-containing protein [Trichonephila clavipes]|uniref:RNase H domain-containing protein n=1 Tax=Trichonephila clavipes TaxID=2585209 RepID=A0A8X6V728_TRICX|nr:RNase H domain-containing protein [Trichonephila clavipes]